MLIAMDKLAGFLERRRLLVLGVWLALLLAAAPFAARQTEHLTSGGFEVPGSQSQVVDRNLERFEGAQRESLAVVLAKQEGAGAAQVRGEIERVEEIAARLPHAAVAPAAAARAVREAGDASITIVPLRVSGEQDELADLAVDFRAELSAGSGAAGATCRAGAARRRRASCAPPSGSAGPLGSCAARGWPRWPARE